MHSIFVFLADASSTVSNSGFDWNAILELLKEFFGLVAAIIGVVVAIIGVIKLPLKKKDRSTITLRKYYDFIEKNFEKDPTSGEEILGKIPLREAYIEPNVVTKVWGESQSLLEQVETWFNSDKYGVLLVHGEPGHGKTTFSNKLVYDFATKQRFGFAKNVLQFPLRYWNIDTSKKPYYGLESIFKYKNIDPIEGLTSVYDLKPNTLLILDGFDEIALSLQDKNINKYEDFKELLCHIAQTKNIHIIVTSRTNAVIDYVGKKDERYNLSDALEFAPLTYEQQKNWCTNQCKDCMNADKDKSYKTSWDEYYNDICKSTDEATEDFRKLLSIPFIFRMIVHCDYRMIGNNKNTAGLYAGLFKKTLERMGYDAKTEKFKVLNTAYQKLAYDIWCNDEDDTAVLDQDEINEKNADFLLFSYYLTDKTRNRTSDVRVFGFLHRSLYQYYMALYLYNQIIKCNEKNSKDFLERLNVRKIDKDILRLFGEIVSNGEHIKRYNESAKNVINAISVTVKNEQLQSRDNVYKNALNLCFYFDVVDEFNNNQELKQLMKQFDCSNVRFLPRKFAMLNYNKRIDLSNIDLSRADLNNADLSGAHLSGTNLSDANLRGADLRYANLSGANLSGANLSNADLSRADLSRADLSRADLNNADLSGAHLSGANLSGADLFISDLSGANLSNADLSGANLSPANLSRADLNDANLSGAFLVKGALDNVKNVSDEQKNSVSWFDTAKEAYKAYRKDRQSIM